MTNLLIAYEEILTKCTYFSVSRSFTKGEETDKKKDIYIYIYIRHETMCNQQGGDLREREETGGGEHGGVWREGGRKKEHRRGD